VRLEFGVADCSSGSDADEDGLADGCELELARAFAPLMVVQRRGCEGQPLDGLPGGGWLHAVQPVGDGAVRIAYLPAYFMDCGWRGAKCLLPWVNCDPHAGDSELVLIDVEPAAAGAWRTVGVFLSAHCFGFRPRGCRWFRGNDLDPFEWLDGRARGAPVVWVAAGRNANYPSRAACDRGHGAIDSCDGQSVRVRFPVRAEGDLGSRARPIGGDGCVGGRAVPGAPEADATECFWSDRPFRGWTPDAPGVTSYDRYLREVASF